jgi:AcrR family transcriptional regulator
VRCKTPLQADKILAAAARLFASHRFHEARMEDVAALAEVGKGTLYRYFKDKEELYLALLARAAEDFQAHLRAALAQADSPRAKLVAVVRSVLDYFDEHPHVLDLIQHAEAMQKPGQQLSWQKTRNETTALVLKLFEEGKRASAFAVDDSELAALMLLGGLRSVLRFGSRPRPADQAERIVAGFLNGYGGTNVEADSAPPSTSRPSRSEKRAAASDPPSAAVPCLTPVIDGASSSIHNA